MVRIAMILPALLLMTAAPAQAQQCVAPPGTGAIDEYCETVPTASGDRGSGDPQRAGVPLPGRTVAELERSQDGQALNRVLKQDPASRAERRAKGEELPAAPAPRSGQPVPREPESNPFSAVQEAIAGGPSTGPLLGLTLFLITLVMLGGAWLAYRRRPQS